MSRSLILLFMLLLPGTLLAWQANADSLNFPASQLSDYSVQYVGSAQNWPVLSKIAIYDSQTNRFQIPREELPRLSTFRESWDELERSRATFSQLILEGGRVFAADELMVLDSLFSRHRRYVNDANLESSITVATEIGRKMADVESLIEVRRKADVEARLEQKTGIVDRRKGLISEWGTASIGELFQRSDGVRTGQESQAQLVFLDGSDVVLYENTTAIIRQSQVDKLTNRSEVELELSSGGVLTRLSAAARNQSDYTVNAGSSSSNVRSSSFWAEAQSDDRVILSNYDGEVLVSASNSEVTLQENEGTIVVRGREPSAPVQLLQAPNLGWERPDSVIYNDSIILRWGRVDNASFYEIDLAPNRTFDAGLRTHRTESTEANLTNIPNGVSYVQVRAFDSNGLRGNNTNPIRLLRISSTEPPPIILDTRDQQVVYTFDTNYQLTGTTQPGSRLTVNGNTVRVDQAGRFSASLTIDNELEATIESVDPAGNRRTVQQTIRHVNIDALYTLRWSVPATNEGLRRAPQILVSGNAYDFMTVHISSGNTNLRVPVGSGGQWSRQFSPGNASEVTITFTDRQTGETIAESSFPFVN
ncbi:MAG: FecR domain-containing protein [Balneolales bacterium]|nr:FecR domain-containing protein [Balneolales bacterium]